MGLLAAFTGLFGLLLFSSAVWFAVIALVAALLVAGYGIYRVAIGRHKDILCPICGATGEVVKIQQSYQFHCAHCDMTADTGVSSHGGGAYS